MCRAILSGNFMLKLPDLIDCCNKDIEKFMNKWLLGKNQEKIITSNSWTYFSELNNEENQIVTLEMHKKYKISLR